MTGANGGRQLARGVAAGLAFLVVQLLARLFAGVPTVIATNGAAGTIFLR